MHNYKDEAVPSDASIRERRRPLLAALIAATTLAFPFGGEAADFQRKFEQVSIGLTEEAVVSLMGAPPTSTQQTSTIGVPTSRMYWEEPPKGSVFKVTF